MRKPGRIPLPVIEAAFARYKPEGPGAQMAIKPEQ